MFSLYLLTACSIYNYLMHVPFKVTYRMFYLYLHTACSIYSNLLHALFIIT